MDARRTVRFCEHEGTTRSSAMMNFHLLLPFATGCMGNRGKHGYCFPTRKEFQSWRDGPASR